MQHVLGDNARAFSARKGVSDNKDRAIEIAPLERFVTRAPHPRLDPTPSHRHGAVAEHVETTSSPLHVACQSGHRDAVVALLRAKVRKGIKNLGVTTTCLLSALTCNCASV